MRQAIWITILVLAGCPGTPPPPSEPPVDAPPPPRLRCDFADCRDGFSRTCDKEPDTLDCTAFAASCGVFTDTDSQDQFRWCDCGSLAESEGFCLGGRNGVICLQGLGGLSDCGLGFECVDKPNSPFGIGCECNNIPDGICPAIACGSDPDCAQCTPDCTGRTCGDNGCGGECGTCDVGKQCSALGQCEAICVPNCIDRQCGDDGCGGSCGTCDGTCRPDGTCDGTCVPTGCGGKECGTDGCTEGACGGCTDGLECSNDNLCDCPFFSTVKYTFTLAPQAGFPADFTSVALNLTHVGLKDALKKDGAVLGFATGQKQTFTMTVNGCRPKIRIKREYTLTGGSCVADQLITGRTDFTISPPTPQAGGGCTTTAL